MIYLDNSATTVVSAEAAYKMRIAAEDIWGNPSSIHNMGLAAGRLIEEARTNILSSLGVNDKNTGCLIFCGSGTEANNLAVFGTAYAKTNTRRKRIITDNSQHSSVAAPLRRLEQNNFEIIRIPTIGGKLDTDMLIESVNEDTVLVTVILVNNETGARYDVENAFKRVKAINPKIVCHTDAVQAFKKIKFTPESLHTDLISVSGHKLHAPKGIGALYIKDNIIKSKKIIPIILGGGQETGFRSGTENVPAIAAFGEAVKASYDLESVIKIREYLLLRLPDEIKANIPAVYVPHIISITLPRIKSETMLHFLSAHGICVSNGSACSSHGGHVSPVLTSFGLTKLQADCTVRVSLCGTESLSDIDVFIDTLKDGIKSLIRIK
ncbi:MAG: cysteine desulfurase family protein [Eubacteriales bacterium]